MLSRTERIDEYHLRLSRTEKEVYEEFLKTEEAALVQEMQQYFIQAKAHAGGIRFDNGRYTFANPSRATATATSRKNQTPTARQQDGSSAGQRRSTPSSHSENSRH
jgi:hypothetical protein